MIKILFYIYMSLIKCFVKKKGLNDDFKLFKLFILSHCLALSGSEFHNFEAARIKTAHRNALVFQVAGLLEDFIYLIVVFLLVRKAATCLLRCVTPDHNNSSLNFNLCLIGNQYNSLRTGFM